MPTVRGFGSALLKAVEGILDAAIGIITDGFIVDTEEEDEARTPGSIAVPRVRIMIDFRRIKKHREDREILELL